MKDRLKDYLEELFARTPRTAYAQELKEEMFANMVDKYEDLLIEGKTAEEAYIMVTSNIGDIRELLSGLDESVVMLTTKDLEKRRKKSALINSIAIGLYILSGAVVIGMSIFDSATFRGSEIGVVICVIIVAIATGMLIYDSNTKPKVLEEEYKEKKRREALTPQERKTESIKNGVFGILWAVTTAIYLLFSFTTNNWGFSWIIFIIGGVVRRIINLLFTLGEKDNE